MCDSLEATLLALARWGRPRLSMTDRGWHCAIDVFVAAEGVSFEAKSDFTHSTPLEAAQESLNRLMKAVHTIDFNTPGKP